MGGRATFGGTDFQARVAAYFAAHIVARQKLPPYGLPRGVPIRIWYEQPEGAGDDLRLETADGRVYEIQAKHGLNADKRLAETIDRFVEKLASQQFGLLAVDRGTSSATITEDLRTSFTRWRNGEEFEIARALRDKIARLLSSEAGDMRIRMAVAPVDLDEDANDGVRYVVSLLERRLLDPSQAEFAWAALFKISSHASKYGYSYDRNRLVALLEDEGLSTVADSVADLQGHQLRAATLPSLNEEEVPPELQLIAAMIDHLQPTAALAALEALSRKAPSTNRERAQRLTLQAAALLHLGQAEEARPLVEQALVEWPAHLPALLDLIVAAEMLGDQDAALRYAREATEVASEDPRSWAARAHIGDIRPDEIPEAFRDKPQVLAGLGAAALRRKDALGAIKFLEDASAADPAFSVHRAQLLAGALYLAAQGASSVEHGKLLERVISLLDQVIAAVSDTRAEIRRAVAENRALALEALGRSEEALDGYKQLARELPARAEAIVRYAERALALSRHVDDALRSLEALGASTPLALASSLKARLLAVRGDRAEAGTQLATALDDLARRSPDLELSVSTAVAALELGDSAGARTALSYAPESSRDTRALVLSARVASLEDRVDETVNAYETALSLASTENDRAIRLEYASFLRTRAMYHQALDAVAQHAKVGDEEVLRFLTETAFAAGQFSKAESFALLAETPSVWAARLHAWIAVRRHDLARAEHAYVEWQSLEPGAIEPSFAIAQLRAQRGDAEGARAQLNLIDPSRLAPIARLELAGIWMLADDPERALDEALVALRDAPDDDEVLRWFVGTALAAGQRVSPVTPTSIVPGVSVTLQTSEGAQVTYLIRSDSAERGMLRELAADDELSQRLLGRRVGEEVLFREGAPQETAQIVELTDARTHAVRWAMEELERRSPSTNAMRSLRLVDDATGKTDFTPLFEAVREKAAREKEVLDRTQQHPLPLGFAAHVLGRSMRDAYVLFVSDETRLLPVEELDPEPAIAAVTEKRLVLTRSGLMTLEALGALHSEWLGDYELLSTPSLFEEMEQEKTEQEHVARFGSSSIGLSSAGGIVGSEITPEEGRRMRDGTQRLIEWLTSHTRVVLPDFPADLTGVWENLVLEAQEATLVAAAEKALLFTDDLGLRRLAGFERGVRGVSTFALLTSLRRVSAISEEAYAEHVVNLLALGHGALPMDVDYLLRAIRRDSSRLRVFSRIVARLKHPPIDAEMAARFVVRLLKLAAIEPVASPNFATIADMCFEAILGPRPTQEPRLGYVLARTIENEFRLLPVQGKRLLAQLAGFRRIRRGGLGS
jgi:tetratricopeptide (TPR) repeat protein